jgi:hypothetical protein
LCPGTDGLRDRAAWLPTVTATNVVVAWDLSSPAHFTINRWSASGNDDADYVRNDVEDEPRKVNGTVKSFEETEIAG